MVCAQGADHAFREMGTLCFQCKRKRTMSRRFFLGRSAKILAASGLALHLPACAPIAKTTVEDSRFHAIEHLHQILIVDGFGMPERVSEIVQARTLQFKKIYPSAHYTLWTGDMLRECIGTHFDKTVLWAFDTLKPYAYKSDLARYCLLHAIGGLYSDLGVIHFRPWQVKNRFAIAGHFEVPVHQSVPYSISNSLLWSQPSHPTMTLAIESIVEHCKTRYYGRNAIDPTGPNLLGRVWASTHIHQSKNGSVLDQALGVASVVWRDDIGAELTFFPTGTANAAVAKRPLRYPGDARYLDLAGTNNYIELWHRRDVYRCGDEHV
jgi:hypothetical protein